MVSKPKLAGALVRMLVVASALALLLPGGAGTSARIESGPEFTAGQTNGTALIGGAVVLGNAPSSPPSKNEWTDMDPASHPGQRTGHAMAYDSENGLVVLFGGYSGDEYINDTWSYNVSNNTWTSLRPSNAPPGRSNAVMAYDSALGLMVLFGGYRGSGGGNGNGSGDDSPFYNDTWTYNVDTNEWTNITPANSPPPMESTSLAYDSKSGLMVLFGGFDTQETWSFDLGTATWTNLSPATAPRLVYVHNMMAYDSEHDQMVIYGGESADTRERSNETWVYSRSENNWTRMNPQTTPPRLAGLSLAYDSTNGVVVLFGGTYRGEDTGDRLSEATWVYDLGLNTWTDMTTSVHPINTNGAGGFRFAMCYDNRNEVMVLFGGLEVLTPAGVTYTYKLVRSQYQAEGVFTSAAIDTGASSDDGAYYGALDFVADLPSNTTLQFRARAGGAAEDLPALPFIGPDGTANSYFDQSGQMLPSSLNRNRWVQYRAYLGTSDTSVTPVLNQVTIRYNLPHTILTVTAPNDTVVKSTAPLTFSAEASDPDGDPLTYDWQDNGVSIGKERSLSYTFAPGNHTLILLIGDGRYTTSRTFNFTVAPPPKTIGTEPASVPGFEAGVAGAAVVSVVAIGLFWRRERR